MVSNFLTPTSPLVIKAELVGLLGSKGRPYWNTLSEFIKAKISRTEFEERVTEWLTTPRLGKLTKSELYPTILTQLFCVVSLHNSLITALIYSASAPLGSDSLDGLNGSKPRSRRRLLAHEKDGDSPRLRRWAVDIGRQERERIRSIAGSASRTTTGAARGKRGDIAATPGLRSEIRSERGVRLMKERGSMSRYFFRYSQDLNICSIDPPGTHLAIPLCETTRMLPTQQNLFDRMSLIASQHDMTSSKTAVALLMTSLDVSLVELA